jgi:hypothetical protein
MVRSWPSTCLDDLRESRETSDRIVNYLAQDSNWAPPECKRDACLLCDRQMKTFVTKCTEFVLRA